MYTKLRVKESTFCPLECLNDFLFVRSKFDGSLFCHEDATPLTRIQFTSILDKCISGTQFRNLCYRTHRFPIDRATDLAQKGAPEDLIMKLGRWQSDAYKPYIP